MHQTPGCLTGYISQILASNLLSFTIHCFHFGLEQTIVPDCWNITCPLLLVHKVRMQLSLHQVAQLDQAYLLLSNWHSNCALLKCHTAFHKGRKTDFCFGSKSQSAEPCSRMASSFLSELHLLSVGGFQCFCSCSGSCPSSTLCGQAVFGAW